MARARTTATREARAGAGLPAAAPGRPLPTLGARVGNNVLTGAVALVVVLFIVRAVTANGLVLTLAEEILALAVLGLSVDLLDGYAGLVSLGQGAFYGAAGYTAGLLIAKDQMGNFIVVSLIALAVTTVLAAVVAVGVLRTSWIYFILLTFAVGQLLDTVTGQYEVFQVFGVQGISGIGFGQVAGGVPWNSDGIYCVVGGLGALAFLIVSVFRNSTFAYRLRGTRDAPVRMSLLGYNVWALRWGVFVLAGLVAGLAGLMTAYSQGLVIPDNFGVTTSAEALIVMMIGGQRRRLGALIGAAIVVLVQYYAQRMLAVSWPIVLGVLYVVMAFLGSQGLVNGAADLWNRARAELAGGRARAEPAGSGAQPAGGGDEH